jgi:hypothetical protein
MGIDTSFPEYSKYLLWLDVPYRYAGRHFDCAFSSYSNSGLRSFKERIKHFSLGVLHLIPLIGHITALFNKILNTSNPKIAVDQDNQKKKNAQLPIKSENLPNSEITHQPNPKSPPLASPLTCPSNYLKYYKKASEKFTQKILISPHFNEKEKKFLFETSTDYETNLSKKDWISDLVSVQYIGYLSMKEPNLRLSPIPRYNNQVENSNIADYGILNEHNLDFIISLCKDFSLFGHCLQVNGNHRTAFVIDLENQTVEFYNSFGCDKSVKKPLQNLATKLSQIHGRPFEYIHKTEGFCLQRDVYQCGAWAPKLIEERARQGKNFNPKTLKGFDIATYRDRLFDKVYKDKFYNRVGVERFTNYLEKNKEESYRHPIWMHPKIQIPRRSDWFYHLGKTGEIPKALLNLIEECERKQTSL